MPHGHEERHALRGQLVQKRLQLVATGGIESGAGIVQHQQGWVGEQGAREQYAARLAVREREERPVRQLVQTEQRREPPPRGGIGTALRPARVAHLEGIDVEHAVEGKHVRHRVARSGVIHERVVARLEESSLLRRSPLLGEGDKPHAALHPLRQLHGQPARQRFFARHRAA